MAMPTPPDAEARPRANRIRRTLLSVACACLLAPALASFGPPQARAEASRPVARPSELRVPSDDPVDGKARSKHAIVQQLASQYTSYSLFLDPDPYVVTKEFAFFYNTVPDPARGLNRVRGLFHLIYQRSAGPQQAETIFGHAWSTDLKRWAVDTLAFAVDTTSWNSAHVWSPSIIHHGAKDYLFYTGVDSMGNQRIGYASTDLLDTTDTEWDPQRVKVWEASDTHWAVPEPWTYGYYTQFRDPFVMDDPDRPGRLLLYYNAHDSTDFAIGRGGLVVGVARSEPGTVDAWRDLGYLPSTLVSSTHVGQLEGPHLVPLPGTHSGWRLMFSNAGTPPGETGETTIRFETLKPGESVSDTNSTHWSTPTVLEQYLKGDPTVFGWSGSEYLHVGDADYLAGFTAWGPVLQGIAMARMKWRGSDFTLGGSLTTAVDEYQSDAKDLRMRVVEDALPSRRVSFVIDSPRELAARLEVFDAMGRRLRTLLAGSLPRGGSSVGWDLTAADGAPVPSGVYFARLSFAGGLRAARISVVR